MRWSFLIEPWWWAEGSLNEARSFFHPDLWGWLGRCLSSDFKRNILVQCSCPRGARPHQDPPQGLTFTLESFSPSNVSFFSFLLWSRHKQGVVVSIAYACSAAEWTGCSLAACLNDESAAPSSTGDVQVLENCASREHFCRHQSHNFFLFY